MLARLGHGILLGAVLCGAAGLVECVLTLLSYPYHRDPGLWWRAMPSYFAAGATLGCAVGLFLPFVTNRQDRQAAAGLFMACLMGCGLFTIYCLYRLHAHWLPGTIPSLHPLGLFWTGVTLAGGGLLYFLFWKFARSRRAWLIASWFQPLTLVALAVLLCGSALLGRLLPIQPAPLGQATKDEAVVSGAPNVLMVVLDTVAASRLSCYGHYRATSPELDRLAAQGVLFQSAFATAPWTVPSHASIFTGLHPNTHQTGWYHARLEDGRSQIPSRGGFLTLAEELGRRGFDTCAMADKSWISFHSGLTQGFNKVWDYATPSDRDRLFLFILMDRIRARFQKPTPAEDKGAKRLVDTALHWLGGARERDQERPFFLFLNLNEAHDPYMPPGDFARHFLPEGIRPAECEALNQDVVERKKWECGLREWVPKEPAILQALYDGELLYQDQQLGRLLEGLRNLELMENTLVIVTADHGEEFGENGRLGHQLALSDALLRVPLVMRYPKRLRAGLEIKNLASLVDLFPTVIDLIESETGKRVPRTPDLEALEGVSLLPMMETGIPAVRDFVLAHYFNPAVYLRTYPCWSPDNPEQFPLQHLATSQTMIRTANQKYIAYGNRLHAFYDLEQDPREHASPAYKVPSAYEDSADRLGRRMWQQLAAHEQRRLLLVSPINQLPGFVRPTGWRNPVTAAEEAGYVGESSGPDSKNVSTITELERLVPPPFMNKRAHE